MELLAPAGGFSSALYAFSGGADAVYAGMQRFSARQGAQNFTFEEFRRLKGAAESQGKKIYAALNTLVMDQELSLLYEQLDHCAYLQVDAVIVQDIGVADIIRREYPSLTLHGSTQMTVHTIDGARQLQDMGFSRAVLARELSIDEIHAIIAGCPDLSYEVFIHGALCYSVSGLCLASGRMLGRSANRGMCAQICRTWLSGAKNSRKGYFFSMKDLHGADFVRQLCDIGVNSLKIEGRMKSPEYCEAASMYYRRIIDEGNSDIQQHKRLRLLFSRDTTNSWLAGSPQDMTSTGYPSHIGIPAGRVVSSTRTHAVLSSQEPLSLHDGLLAHIHSKNPSVLDEWIPFSITDITIGSNHLVTLAVPRQLPVGTEIRKISDHRLRRPAVRSSSNPPWQHPVDVVLTVSDTTITCRSLQGETYMEAVIALQRSRRVFDFPSKAAEVFSASGNSLYTLGRMTLLNRSSYPDDQLFVPPSQLKQLRRDWYALLDETFAQTRKHAPHISAVSEPAAEVPKRDLLSPKTSSGPGWVVPGCPVSPQDLYHDDRYCCIPLSPVRFNADGYEDELRSLLSSCAETYPGLEPLLGINTIGHIPLVNRLIDENTGGVWIDVYCYIANSRTAQALLSLIRPPIRFGYRWIEQKGPAKDFRWPFPSGEAGDASTLPVFMSRTSFEEETGLSEGILTQQGRTFRVHEYRGITYVFTDT